MGNSSKKTVQSTTYKNTTTSNPYVVSSTNNKGTTSNFVDGTAYDTVNKFVNKNIGNLLDEYLNPSLDSVTNKAKLNNYSATLSGKSKSALENDIITPLSDRKMIRSSQATNMYKNLSNNISNNISNYANELLSNSRSETASMLSTLLSAYMDGVNTINSNQSASLATSKGNANVSGTSATESSMGKSQESAQYLAAIAKVIASFM